MNELTIRKRRTPLVGRHGVKIRTHRLHAPRSAIARQYTNYINTEIIKLQHTIVTGLGSARQQGALLRLAV